MKHLNLGPLCYEFSRHLEPRIEIDPGDTIIVETEDAFSGQIRTAEDRRDRNKIPQSNPQTGPIAIRGAQPGDALAITLRSIEPLIGQCATRTGEARQLAEWLGPDCPHGTRICPIREGSIHWSDSVRIPYAPMLGCLATAPAWGTPTTLLAGPYGGNLDIVEVAPRSIVFLPVFVPGALLYLGDAHAAMGHGELSGSGLEMPAATTLTVEVLSQFPLSWPRVETETEIMAIVSGTPQERSLAQAYVQLILWLEADYGFDRWEAYDLLTHVGRVSVGWYALGTVAAKVEKRYLRRPARNRPGGDSGQAVHSPMQ
ncbi:MAG TPA: acetamidase/formamidase family protein [Pirellulales bacterium]|jgi:acetamidase/formamidase|nr:acetamidase/formamidase family protein [Pirellulales bacterium]